MGGVQTHIATIAKNICEFDFRIVTDAVPHYPLEESYSNCRVIRILPRDYSAQGFSNTALNKVVFPYSMVADLIRFRNKRKLFLRGDYDIVHFHGGGMIGTNVSYFMTNFVKRPLFSDMNRFDYIYKPKLLTVHGLYQRLSDSRTIREYEDEFIRQFDNIICVDKNIHTFLQNQYGNDNRSIHFIPNPVDTRLFYNSDISDGDRITIGFVGRLGADRGIHLLAMLANHLPPYVDLKIIGAGSKVAYDRFISMIRHRPVSLAMNIDNNAIPDFLRDVDLVLNPVMPEGISRITLEAMSCGRPVIMLNHGDRYPVINDVTGYIINNDPKELLSLIESIHRNKDELRKLGRKARKLVEQEYSIDAIMPQILGVYKGLLV
jgi:glycosyltransferase involved in cell wall biosynthesis